MVRETGAIAAGDLQELISRLTTLTKMVPNGAAVRSVLTMAGGKDLAGPSSSVPTG